MEFNGNQTVCLPTFFRCSVDDNLTGLSETRVNDVKYDRIFIIIIFFLGGGDYLYSITLSHYTILLVLQFDWSRVLM